MSTYWTYMIQISWPCFAFVIILYLIEVRFFVQDIGTSSTTRLIISALSEFAYCATAIAWHNYLIRNEKINLIKIWSSYKTWYYTVFSFVLMLLSTFPFLFVYVWFVFDFPSLFFYARIVSDSPFEFWNGFSFQDWAIPVIGVIGGIVTMIVSLRLSVALVAIALNDQNFGFGEAWRSTKGNSFRLLAIYSMNAIPFVGAYILIGELQSILSIREESGLVEAVVFTPLYVVLYLVAFLTFVTILSLVYSVLVEESSSEPRIRRRRSSRPGDGIDAQEPTGDLQAKR